MGKNLKLSKSPSSNRLDAKLIPSPCFGDKKMSEKYWIYVVFIYYYMFLWRALPQWSEELGLTKWWSKSRPSYRENKDELRSLLKMSKSNRAMVLGKRQEEPMHSSVQPNVHNMILWKMNDVRHCLVHISVIHCEDQKKPYLPSFQLKYNLKHVFIAAQ